MDEIFAVGLVIMTTAAILRFLYVGFCPQSGYDEHDAITELGLLGLAIVPGSLGSMMTVYDAFFKVCPPNASPLC